MKPLNTSLRRILLIPFVLLIVVLTSIITWISYQTATDALDHLSQNLLQNTTIRISDYIRQQLLIQEKTAKIISLSIQSSQQKASASEVAKLLSVIAADLSKTKPLAITYQTQHDRIKINAINKQTTLQAEQNTSKLLFFKTPQTLAMRDANGVPLLQYIYPLNDVNGSLIGFIQIEWPLVELEATLNEIHKEHTLVYIFDQNQALISPPKFDSSFPHQNLKIKDSFLKIQAWLEQHPKKIKQKSYTLTQPFLLHAENIEHDTGLDWTIIATIPRSDLWLAIKGTLYRNLFIGFVTIVCVLILGVLVLNWVTRDLRRLIDMTKTLEQGNPLPPVDIFRKDEIGQLAQSFAEMERNLRIDHLTGLLNRSSFLSQLEFRLRRLKIFPLLPSDRSPRFAVLFIDLDRFKAINDRYGHEAGDKVLIEVAKRLRSSLRTMDVVGRYGGDEFIVLLNDIVHDTDITNTCEKISSVLEVPIDLGMNKDRIGASIGVSIYPTDADNTDDLIRLADERMFKIKRTRKNKYIYS